MTDKICQEKDICRQSISGHFRTLTFIVETIYPIDAGTFVVPSQEEEALWVLDLVGKEKANGLQGLLPPIHVVTEKEVVGFWWE